MVLRPKTVVCFLSAEWVQQYTESFVQPDRMQKIVDSFMEDYDKRKEEVRIQQLLLHDEPPACCL